MLYLFSSRNIFFVTWIPIKKQRAFFIIFKKSIWFCKSKISVVKIEADGVRGMALKWFASFLYGRTQKVRIGSNLSLPLPVGVGVPRGSVTFVTLFFIFINNLLNLTFKSEICALADDIVFLYSEINSQSIMKNMNAIFPCWGLGIVKKQCLLM